MVSNFDRIFAEIKKEVEAVASDHGLDADALIELIMDIVNLEDKNLRVTVPRIHQTVENKIHDVAIAQMNREDR